MNRKLRIELEVNDAVYSFLDLYLRKVAVTNSTDANREVRVFFSHDFHIYGEDAGDTVMYEPTLQSIIHYKRKRYFLINGITDQNTGIHEFATGQKGIVRERRHLEGCGRRRFRGKPDSARFC